MVNSPFIFVVVETSVAVTLSPVRTSQASLGVKAKETLAPAIGVPSVVSKGLPIFVN